MREAEPYWKLVKAEQTRCGKCRWIDDCPRNEKSYAKVSMRGQLVPAYFAERCELFKPKEITAKQP